MIADYNEAKRATYTDLMRQERLEYLNEALGALVVATESLRKLVKAELGEGIDTEGVNEAHLTSIRQLGHHVIKLAETASESNSEVDTTAPQERAEPEIIEPDVKEIIIQPAVDNENPTEPLRKKQNNFRKKKSYPIPLDNPLYARILTEEVLPPIETAEDTDPIEIEIISEDTILFNGKEIRLKGDSLFIFNAFMLLRDQQAITAKMIRERGFRIPPSPTASTNLGITLNKLRNQLTLETDSGTIELIARQGEGRDTTYSVNPAIVRNNSTRVVGATPSGFTNEEVDHDESLSGNSNVPNTPEITIGTTLHYPSVSTELDIENQSNTETSSPEIPDDVSPTPLPEITDGPSEDDVVTLETELKARRQGEGPISVKSLPAHVIKRLYAQVAFEDEVPSIEMSEEIEPIQIRILSEKSIALADKVKLLDGDELFLFNAFMKLRDRDAITAADIRELGYRQGMSGASTTSLIAAIEKLRGYLQAESEDGTVELISKREGDEYDTYKVNEAIISTEVVREGTTLIIQYLEEDESENEATKDDDAVIVRIAKRNEPHDANKDTTRLDPNSPLGATLLGAKIEEKRDFKTPDGDIIKVKVIEIE